MQGGIRRRGAVIGNGAGENPLGRRGLSAQRAAGLPGCRFRSRAAPRKQNQTNATSQDNDQSCTQMVMRQKQDHQQRYRGEENDENTAFPMGEIQRHPQPFPLRVLVDEQPGILPVDIEKTPAFHRHFSAFRPFCLSRLTITRICGKRKKDIFPECSGEAGKSSSSPCSSIILRE